MKKEILPTLLYKTKSDSQKFGGHWFRGENCNFIPSKKHFNDKDFFTNKKETLFISFQGVECPQSQRKQSQSINHILNFFKIST